MSELLDDFALRPLLPEQTADLLEVIEDRTQLRSTILASQLPVTRWHDALGEPTLADALLDRLVHTAHRIELHGPSLRDPRDDRPLDPADRVQRRAEAVAAPTAPVRADDDTATTPKEAGQ